MSCRGWIVRTPELSYVRLSNRSVNAHETQHALGDVDYMDDGCLFLRSQHGVYVNRSIQKHMQIHTVNVS